MKTLSRWQDGILRTLAGKVDNYCLGGGTALSKAYFHHRQSFDLDFFTLEFNRKAILSLIKFLSESLHKDFRLISEQSGKDKVRIMIFSSPLTRTEAIKIDFIEDYIKRLKPARQIDGIRVFALEDIYLRKIYAVTGTIEAVDTSAVNKLRHSWRGRIWPLKYSASQGTQGFSPGGLHLIGRKVSRGGRQEAKDFFDLYFLSHTFMNLSDFSFRYCNAVMQEALVRWFRTYSRMDIKTDLLELKTKNKFDYREMEGHFKQEIGRLLEKQIGRV